MSSEESLVRIIVDDLELVLDLPESERDHVQSQIRKRRRFYEDDLLEHMRTMLEPGSVVVDAGAYVGNHALFLSRVCGARVLAFEPNPESCEVLRRNVALNDVGGAVSVHPVALGANEARGVLFTPSRVNLGDTRVLEDAHGPVAVVPLDAIELPGPVAAMKIDVQGMELAVLSGARATIQRDRPCIYVEVHTAAALAEVATMLAEWSYVPRAQFGTSPTVLFVPAGRAPYDTGLQLAMAQHRILSVMTSQGGRLATLVQRGASERPAPLRDDEHAGADDDAAGSLATSLHSMHTEVAHLRLRIEQLADRVESDHRSRVQADERIERAIHAIIESVDPGAVLRSLSTQEIAIKRVEAELFSLRGRIEGRARSLLHPSDPGPAPKSRVAPTQVSPGDWQLKLRKLRKLTQTPRKFLTDSDNPWLRRSGDLLGVAQKRWKK